MTNVTKMFEDEEEKTKTAEDQSFFLFITGTFTGNLSGCPDSGHFFKLKILLNRLIFRQLRRSETKMVKHLTYALIFFTNFFQEYSANRINSVYIEPGGY